MRIILSILIGILLLGGYSKSYSTEVDDKEKLNLLKQLSQTASNDTMRLVLLDKLRLISRTPQVEVYYIKRLLQEAEAMKNAKYICKAYVGYMVVGYNNYNPQEVNRWMKLLEPIARKEKLYDELFFAKRCVIDMFLVTEEYERQEKESLKMLSEAQKLNYNLGIVLAYQCLANVYRMTYRFEKAVDVLKKAYGALNSDEGLRIEILNSLIGLCREMKDYPNWLKWTKIQNDYLHGIIKQEPGAVLRLRAWLMMNYISYLSYYTRTGNYQLAEKYLHLADANAVMEYDTFNYNYYLARYNYFIALKRWEEALIEVERLIQLFKDTSPLSYNGFNFRKATILHQLKRDSAALDIYKSSFAMNDSIRIVILNKQSEQLKKDYNADKLLLEKERISRNTQLVFLTLLIVILLFLTIFIIHIYLVRGRLKRSEEEMRRLVEEVEQANVAKEFFLSTISKAISVPMNKIVDGSMALAFNKVTDEEQRKELSESINSTSVTLMGMINNILDFSRLEAGMMKYREEEINILMVLRSLLDTMPDFIQKRLKTELPQEETIVVWIDVVRLQTILNNLFLNSSDDSTLKVERMEKEQTVRITVTGSILSSGEDSQDIHIANDVNRLIVTHFKGKYEVLPDVSPSLVWFEFPLVKA